MSLKNIELQIALPRTLELSRNQQIQQNQTNLQSAQAEAELAKQSVRMEQTVIDTKDNARTKLRDRQGQQQPRRENKQKQQAESEAAADHSAPHPYKGQRLDIKM